MKKVTKKTVVKKTAKKKPVKIPQLSTALSTESFIARMVDVTDPLDRLEIIVEFIKGCPRKFQSDTLLRMTRESCALVMERAQGVYNPKTNVAPPAAPVKAPVATKDLSAPVAPVTEPAEPVAPPLIKDSTIHQLVVGPYGSKHGADQDVLQFKSPKVMRYRPSTFPDTTSFKVKAAVIEAKTILLAERTDIKPRSLTESRAYPYGIELTVAVEGDLPARVRWLDAFKRANHYSQVNKT